ncbi:MAG TPA: gliding motility-associated C-terminal domain-containing protein [Mucilaginibacter sp.]
MPAVRYHARFKRADAIFLIAILLVLAGSNYALAQTCTGSAGEPIVNTTFGNNTGQELDYGTTSFRYVPGCPADGSYTIVNGTTGCYTGWHTVIHDHTGDSNGLFMLVNATTDLNDIYVKRVDGLCSGTTYQFSAWLLNMAKTLGTDPNVTFIVEKLDNTEITRFNPGDIAKTATPTWQQYGFTFPLPAGVSSVIIRIRNNAPGGTGNDLALDDIMFRPMGPPITVGIQDVAGTSVTVCQNSPQLTLFANVGTCFPHTSYQWQVYRSDIPSSSWTDIGAPNSPTCNVSTILYGVYQYRLVVADDGNIQSPKCRTISAPLNINISSPVRPIINIIPSKTSICASEEVTFNTYASSVGQGTPTYIWLINGVSVNNPEAQYVTTDLRDGDVVTCQLISNLTCAVPASSQPVTMHVSGVAPVINVTASANNVCAGTPVTFTATTNQTTGISYQWQINGVTKPFTNATFTSTDLKNGSIVTCMVSSSTCTTPVSSDAIKMNIIDAVPSVSIVTSNTTVCPNTAVTFNADQIPGASYQWQINGNATGSNNAVLVAPRVNDGDVVNCLVLTDAACSAPISTNSITMHVSSPITSVVLSASPATACKGAPVTLTATADQTTGASYRWLVNGQTVTGTENTLVKTDLNNNDVVTCQVTTTGNCSPPVQSNPITIAVTDLPQINLPDSSYQIYNGESVTLAATATGTGLTYQWSPAVGLDRTDIANPIAHPTQTTQYTLLVTNAGGCTQTSHPVTVKVLIKDIVAPNSFTPNNDGINDKWEIRGLSDDPRARIMVYNRYGAAVFSSVGYQSSWDGTCNGKILPTGVYYYNIRLSDKTRKFTGYVAIIR